MSKLDRELLKRCIADLLAFSEGKEIKCPDPKKAADYNGEPPETDPPTLHKMGRGNVKDGKVQGKKRKFTETVELQIALKNYGCVKLYSFQIGCLHVKQRLLTVLRLKSSGPTISIVTFKVPSSQLW